MYKRMHYWGQKGRYQKEYEWIWDFYVPKTGPCGTPEAELVRLCGRLIHDYFNNGFCNWHIYIEYAQKLYEQSPDELKPLVKSFLDVMPDEDDTTDCDECGGSGYVTEEEEVEEDGDWHFEETEEYCYACDGTGEMKVLDNMFYVEDIISKAELEKMEKLLETMTDKMIEYAYPRLSGKEVSHSQPQQEDEHDTPEDRFYTDLSIVVDED